MQVVQNSPWIVEETITANEAGMRPSTLGAYSLDPLSRTRLEDSHAYRSAEKMCKNGNTARTISIQTVDPYSLDSVKRVYINAEFFPDVALVPHTNGFTVFVSCGGDVQENEGRVVKITCLVGQTVEACVGGSDNATEAGTATQVITDITHTELSTTEGSVKIFD